MYCRPTLSSYHMITTVSYVKRFELLKFELSSYRLHDFVVIVYV